VRHHPFAVEQPQDGARDEGAEDRLEAEDLRENDEADE
jgi:hypothetical protein